MSLPKFLLSALQGKCGSIPGYSSALHGMHGTSPDENPELVSDAESRFSESVCTGEPENGHAIVVWTLGALPRPFYSASAIFHGFSPFFSSFMSLSFSHVSQPNQGYSVL
jgi:hypothetical protein